MEINEKAVQAMHDFLEALGLDLQHLGMEKTPQRVAEMYAQFFSGLQENPDDQWQQPIITQSNGLVAVRNIRFIPSVNITYCLFLVRSILLIIQKTEKSLALATLSTLSIR